LPANFDSVQLENNLQSIRFITRNQTVELNSKKYSWQAYEFSWRWGLKDDPGHQGFHGLKSLVNDEIISFGIQDPKTWVARPIIPMIKEPEGSIYYLWSTVWADSAMTVQIKKGGLLPTKVFINATALVATADQIRLQAGANTILLKYNTVGRGYFVFEKNQTKTAVVPKTELATNWYNNPSVLKFNCYPEEKQPNDLYRFQSPPGVKQMYVTAKKMPEAWADGLALKVERTSNEVEKNADKSIPVWRVTFPASIRTTAQVALRIAQTPGEAGAAALPEAITYDCGTGLIQAGNLYLCESLRNYSGGMWYRKTFSLTPQQLASKELLLDLGDLVSSAEVFLNGQSLGVKLTPPWQFDLKPHVNAANNKLEILIYNTLGNHYLNTPSKYVGRTKSGLVGPVIFKIHE